jgi:hypothetical protein
LQVLNVEGFLVGPENKLSSRHQKWVTLSVVGISVVSNALRVGLNRNIFVVIPLLVLFLLTLISLIRMFLRSRQLLAVIDEASGLQGLTQETLEKHADIRTLLHKMKLGSLALFALAPILGWLIVVHFSGGLERKTIIYNGPFMATLLSSWQWIINDYAQCIGLLLAVYVLWIPADVRNQVVAAVFTRPFVSTSHLEDIPPEPSPWMVEDTHGEESSAPLRVPLEVSVTQMTFLHSPSRVLECPQHS